MGKNKAEQRVAKQMREAILLPVRVEQVKFEEEREQAFLSMLRRGSRPIVPVVVRVK